MKRKVVKIQKTTYSLSAAEVHVILKDGAACKTSDDGKHMPGFTRHTKLVINEDGSADFVTEFESKS